MSSFTPFAIVRDGQTRIYAHRYASAIVHREIVYGPADFEAWVSHLDSIDEWPEDCHEGAVADFDRHVLVWRADASPLQVPRAFNAFQRLLKAAWPGFDVQFAGEGAAALGLAAGNDAASEWNGNVREASVSVVGRIHEHEEPDEGEEIDPDDEPRDGEFGADETRAWATIIEKDGAVRHRWIEEIPLDLIDNEEDPLNALRDLPPAQAPPEKVVSEGVWIDEAQRSISLWGKPDLRSELSAMRKEWKGWDIEWVEDGYTRHCEASRATGTPLTDIGAVASFLPAVLTTLQVDPTMLLAMLGGGLKRTAIKATGCLLALVCLPIAIFALISGNWQAALITVAIVTAVFVLLFMLIERGLKRKFAALTPRGKWREGRATVAGPQSDLARCDRIDGLLASAGLPRLSELQPHMTPIDERNLLDVD